MEHIPWVLKNIPIPRGSYDKVITTIWDKIKSGIYEMSNYSYRSRWFAVLKKDGKSIWLVHDLQPLNQVLIKDSAVPPTIEPYVELFGAWSIYTVFDLFVGFNQRELAVQSRDLTTFQTPLRTFRLTSIPMGYTNLMQIFYGDMTFILSTLVCPTCSRWIQVESTWIHLNPLEYVYEWVFHILVQCIPVQSSPFQSSPV